MVQRKSKANGKLLQVKYYYYYSCINLSHYCIIIETICNHREKCKADLTKNISLGILVQIFHVKYIVWNTLLKIDLTLMVQRFYFLKTCYYILFTK